MNIRRFQSFFFLLLIIFSLVITVSCQQRQPGDRAYGTPSFEPGERAAVPVDMVVVTTILPLYDAAKSIGGDLVEVHNLLPPGGSPHTFEPGTQQVRALEDSQIVFKLGLGLDDWLDRTIRGTRKKDRRIITVSENIETIPITEDEHETCCPGHSHAGSAGVDPHIWMDPVRMKEIAANIRDAYIHALPVYTETFQKNYDEYANQLDSLDEKYRTTLEKFAKKDFVTYHSFLNYLAQRYNLRQVAVITESPGKEPDPQEIVRVVNRMKDNNVKVVFAEPQFSPRSAEVIAGETGAKVYFLDPLGSTVNSDRNSYVKNMETNLKTLEEAFTEQYGNL
jgi:zinc transport system substrate-binding protein